MADVQLNTLALMLDGSNEMSGDIVLAEKADHSSTPAAGKGYLWVKSDTPSSLIFTDDAGTDYDLTDITSTPEGTAILSTGEVGGTKFLREDGDGTSSWQPIPAPEGTSVLSTGPVTDGYVLTADGAGGAAWEAAAGGVDWSTTQTTTGDFTFKLSDAAGASKLSLTDSADAEVFSVDSDGSVTSAAGGFVAAGTPSLAIDWSNGTGSGTGWTGSAWNATIFQVNGTNHVGLGTNYLKVGSNHYIGWSSSTNVGLVADVYLYRDAANTLALRNSTNAQTFNVYNTYTDASNYERFRIGWDANILELVVEAAGTGTARGLQIGEATNNGGHGRIAFPASASNVGGTRVYTFANGRLNLTNSSNANGMIAFGISSSHAGVKTNGTSLAARLADDSAYTNMQASSFEAAQAYTVATLPTGSVGMIARVTDASSPSVGSTVTGGGAAAALCWYNGSNWVVMGV